MSTAVMTRTGVEGVMPDEATLAAKKKPKAKLIFAGLALAAITAGTTAWALGRGKESTDDAFVEGHVASVAARVQGQVIRVNVKDNQLVEVGTVLVEIDDRDANVRLVTAE